MTARALLTTTLVIGIACGSGCANDEEASTSEPAFIPSPETPPTESDPKQPLRDVPGELLVKGRVQILGVTEDGYIPYLLLSSAGQASLEVLDTKTKTSTRIGAAPFGSRVAVREKAIALWTNPQGSYWSGLTVWSAANGVATAPAAASIAPLLVSNADGTRIAMAWGDGSDRFGVTNVATSGSKFGEAPKVVVENVGTGQTTCKPAMQFAGARLFVASCDGGQTSATIRTISEANEVVTLKTNAVAKLSTDTAGTKAFVIGDAGDAEVRSVPTNSVTPIASNVASGMLVPDGSAVVYTTNAGALVRATTSAPITTTSLVASSVREVLLASQDGKFAIVASNAGPLHDLKIAALDAASPLVPLVTTPSGVPIGFTKSQAHFLYLTDVTEADSSKATVRAHSMTSGKDVALGKNVSALALLENESRALVGEVTTNGIEIELVDLETGARTPLIASAYTATAYRKTAYFSVGFQGLYAVKVD